MHICHSYSIESLKNSSIISFLVTKNQVKDTSDVHYIKLSYSGKLLHHIKSKLSKLWKKFCKENFNIKLVLTSFKSKSYFDIKTQF